MHLFQAFLVIMLAQGKLLNTCVLWYVLVQVFAEINTSLKMSQRFRAFRYILSQKRDNDTRLAIIDSIQSVFCKNGIVTYFRPKPFSGDPKIMKIYTKSIFLDKYFICHDCSQLREARNLSYLLYPIKQTLKVIFFELSVLISAEIKE